MDATNLILIGSLPRSGSAWLAGVLNTRYNSLFFHDAILSYQDPIKTLCESLSRNVGMVGTDVMLHHFDKYSAKRVYLYRDINEIAKSLTKYLTIDHKEALLLAEECESLGQSWCEKHEPYVISYKELFDEQYFTKLWFHLFSDYAEPEKIRQMMRLNIQAKPPTPELQNFLFQHE